MNDFKKIPQDVLVRRSHYLNSSVSFEDRFNNDRIRVIESHKDTIKNLSLVSGAIATFSLMLLDSDIPKIQILLVIGSAVLLLSALASFLYLLYINEKVGNRVKNNEDINLKPLDNILLKFEELLEDKINLEQYLEVEKKFIRSRWDLRRDLIKDGRKDEIDHSDEYVGGLFLLGVVYVIMGLIFPYVNCFI